MTTGPTLVELPNPGFDWPAGALVKGRWEPEGPPNRWLWAANSRFDRLVDPRFQSLQRLDTEPRHCTWSFGEGGKL